ncbi:ABC-F family ATP-binding cassette domain-containing protein [Corynebacterium zhongnanshanii]|uniref:ABC-F family ATP-binding cassette domain-containing protein n=1 Tax=Corynebacterium zhongnanshanii TaxID=2768834 RepID=A0ABQ6VF76_9CORY|nr:ABC-F family ATP-binding cassette domain-containing protein [Corynebacterium zhongnanshanii]KAB3523061.1 ABC-F family ATP-binding cassette domain-containing protein [Corynebacterium zhongnanshanii]
MANLINLENVDKSYGLKTLLSQVSLGVNTGDRVGVVGLNGGGKSTLLKILAQTDTPDSGRVSHNNDLRMAMVTQDVLREAVVDETHAHMTVADAILAPLGLEVYEWAGNSKVRAVLNGLGIPELGLDTRVRDLSGGERRRTGLAAALVQDLDLLILDEPTNHLDVEGVQWLADHLLGRNTALVVVTHDRWFLDTVATTTWEVHDGTVDIYEGGYNDWTFARAERARQADAAEQRRQNLARKELAWLRRGAPARTSKPRYRIEAAEALISDVPPVRDSVELMAFSARRQGKKVIELEDATLSTPDGRVLIQDVTWRLGPGERIGLVGVNGSGKTTLLRALAGEVALDSGKRIEGRTVRLGWLRQELDDLDPTRRLLDAVQDVASYVMFGDKELSASQLAERLGFSAKRQRTPVGDLSGGERRRLQLTRVLMAEPNVLLLDEPTNDLDIDTLQELESLLDGWPGTMVVISHDRYLIERVCDSTWALFGDGALTNLPGGIEQYLQRRAELQAAAGRNDNVLDIGADRQGSATAATSSTSATSSSSSATSATSQSNNGLSSQEERQLHKDMKALERKLAKTEQKIEDIHAQMAEAADVSTGGAVDTELLSSLDAQLQAATAEREELEMQWLEFGEKLEG